MAVDSSKGRSTVSHVPLTRHLSASPCCASPTLNDHLPCKNQRPGENSYYCNQLVATTGRTCEAAATLARQHPRPLLPQDAVIVCHRTSNTRQACSSAIACIQPRIHPTHSFVSSRGTFCLVQRLRYGPRPDPAKCFVRKGEKSSCIIITHFYGLSFHQRFPSDRTWRLAHQPPQDGT